MVLLHNQTHGAKRTRQQRDAVMDLKNILTQRKALTCMLLSTSMASKPRRESDHDKFLEGFSPVWLTGNANTEVCEQFEQWLLPWRIDYDVKQGVKS